MSKFEALQVQMAETQLRIMKEQEAHMVKIRELELRKAQLELDTAERLNHAAVRIGESQELPPIKLS
jgi:hypothetical protein